jgi:hypothetical protein
VIFQLMGIVGHIAALAALQTFVIHQLIRMIEAGRMARMLMRYRHEIRSDEQTFNKLHASPEEWSVLEHMMKDRT